MIDPAHIVVGDERESNGSKIPLGIVSITRQRVIWQGQELRPKLLHNWVQTNATRIAHPTWARRRRQGHGRKRHGCTIANLRRYRKRIQVKGYKSIGSISDTLVSN